MSAVPLHPPPLSSSMSFSGDRAQFRWLATRGGLLELVTAGFYRFWLATDIRRHLWSNTTLDDDAFEYTGRGRELFIGFLFALAIIIPIWGVGRPLLEIHGLVAADDRDLRRVLVPLRSPDRKSEPDADGKGFGPGQPAGQHFDARICGDRLSGIGSVIQCRDAGLPIARYMGESDRIDDDLRYRGGGKCCGKRQCRKRGG